MDQFRRVVARFGDRLRQLRGLSVQVSHGDDRARLEQEHDPAGEAGRQEDGRARDDPSSRALRAHSLQGRAHVTQGLGRRDELHATFLHVLSAPLDLRSPRLFDVLRGVEGLLLEAQEEVMRQLGPCLRSELQRLPTRWIA